MDDISPDPMAGANLLRPINLVLDADVRVSSKDPR